MSADFSLALQLLGVGMGTVFLILSFVVISGNTLIRIVNKYLPQQAKAHPRTSQSPDAIAPDTMAAIVAAVEMVTGGKGKITSIEKK